MQYGYINLYIITTGPPMLDLFTWGSVAPSSVEVSDQPAALQRVAEPLPGTTSDQPLHMGGRSSNGYTAYDVQKWHVRICMYKIVLITSMYIGTSNNME